MRNTQCMCLCGPAWAAQCAIRQLVNRGVVAGRRSFRATGREPGCVVLCGGAARWLAMAMIWPCGGWTWRWPLTPLGPVPVSGTLRFQLAVSTPAASICRTEVICIGTTTRCWCFSPQLPRRRPHSDRGRSMRVGPPEKALHPGPDRASPPAPGAVSPPCITARDWGFVSARCYRRPVDPRTHTHTPAVRTCARAGESTADLLHPLSLRRWCLHQRADGPTFMGGGAIL